MNEDTTKDFSEAQTIEQSPRITNEESILMELEYAVRNMPLNTPYLFKATDSNLNLAEGSTEKYIDRVGAELGLLVRKSDDRFMLKEKPSSYVPFAVG